MSATQTAQLMDGTGHARRIVEEAAAKAAEISQRTGTAPVWRRCWWEMTPHRSLMSA
uniref:Uncharacterized protein n=1 Tax=Streptomyces avermitilis TaxID=33903 RepID=A0A499VP62_STRAX|nr:hypothetical protein SAVMC3_06960 [Streptomyces avermitilis]